MPQRDLRDPLPDVRLLEAPSGFERVRVLLLSIDTRVSTPTHAATQSVSSEHLLAHLVAEHEVHVMRAVLNEDRHDRVVNVLQTLAQCQERMLCCAWH